MSLEVPGNTPDLPNRSDGLLESEPEMDSFSEMGGGQEHDDSIPSWEEESEDDYDVDPNPVSQDDYQDSASSSEQIDQVTTWSGDLSSKVEIRLTFEVGETNLSLDKLRTLQPGYAFELETRLAAPVVIKAYGQTLGTGELLQIEDRLGVRLVEVTENGH